MSALLNNALNPNFRLSENAAKKPLVWAIGGGKGGIGKSFLSSNLAIYLAQLSHKVAVIDLDLGGANLHTCLGLDIPSRTLSDFISGKVSSCEDLLIPTQINNLQMISGAQDSMNMADLPQDARKNLIQNLSSIPADIIIFDLGAGTTESTLDFFISANRSIVALTPEPTSIENAYRFIKSAVYRKLRTAESNLGVQRLIAEAMEQRSRLGLKSPADLIRHVETLDPDIGREFRAQIQAFRLGLVLNQVRTQSDQDIGVVVQSVCRKYFGLNTQFLGSIEFDNAVWQAVRKRRPLLFDNPNSHLVGQLSRIAQNLFDPSSIKAVR